MDIGIMIFPTDKSIQPIELAKEVEARGFESLWFPEHSHIPTSRATPWGGFKGMPDLPEEYWRAHDQFVALGACAAVTEKILLGTGITLVAQRDPIWLAKEVATRNITVNTITPGYINTDTVEGLSEKQKETIMTWIPMQKFGDVDDIAAMVGFLASEKAKYVTGQIISVDGGMAI